MPAKRLISVFVVLFHVSAGAIEMTPSVAEDSFQAAGRLEATADGWQSFKVACVAKFKGNEKISVVTEKCVDMINSLKANRFGIVPYSTQETEKFPKVRRGMTREDVLKNFGKPIAVSDDGKTIYYENENFCAGYDHRCVVYFFEPGKRASSWSNFRFEFTDSLKN